MFTFTNLFALLSLFLARSYRPIERYTFTNSPNIILVPSEEEEWNHGEVPWDLEIDPKNKTKPITKIKSVKMISLDTNTGTIIHPFLYR